MSRRYLFSYDIPGDATRSAVSRLLSGYGMRVQWSIFECCLSARELRQVLVKLSPLIDPDCDHLLVFVCAEEGTPATVTYVDQAYTYWIV